MQSSFSNRRNWDYPCHPPPQPLASVPPRLVPGGGGGRHNRLQERGWGVPITTLYNISNLRLRNVTVNKPSLPGQKTISICVRHRPGLGKPPTVKQFPPSEAIWVFVCELMEARWRGQHGQECNCVCAVRHPYFDSLCSSTEKF